jgi:hypothetical protein
MESPHTLKIQELLKRIDEKRKSNAGIPKPTLEEFSGDEKKHRHAVEIWRIGQDERAAQAVLDNAGATFSARENANRTMRRCQKRRQEIEPIGDTAIRARRINDNNPANEIDERPWAERSPYQDLLRSRFLTSDEARQHHENLCLCVDEFERIGKMAPGEQKAYWDKSESDRTARMEQQNLQDQESMQPKFNPRKFKTPLELETWKRQSGHFARLRGGTQ